MINYIKFTFSACSIFSAVLNTAPNVDPILNMTPEAVPEPKSMECQLIDNGLNNFFCFPFGKANRKDANKKDGAYFFKLAQIDKDTFITYDFIHLQHI